MDSETRILQYGSAENEEDQFETTLQAAGEVEENGRFVVDAITAGKGNGWEFSPECLRASLDLWNGSEVFVDHGGFFFRGRSVRDLGGVLTNPRWNSDINGIRCDLDAMGPSAELIETLGQEMLKDTGRNKPRIGFLLRDFHGSRKEGKKNITCNVS